MPPIMYRLREEIVFDEEGKGHSVYGIETVPPQGEDKLSFPDLFFDREKAESFVTLCNEEALSPVHLADVIEDILSL